MNLGGVVAVVVVVVVVVACCLLRLTSVDYFEVSKTCHLFHKATIHA